MSRTQRQLVLNAFFMRFGHHPAAWRHPSSSGDGITQRDVPALSLPSVG